MEEASFKLVRSNRLTEAQALLGSPEYLRQKQIYAAGMEAVLRGVQVYRNEAVTREADRLTEALYVKTSATGIAVALWILALVRVARAWRRKASQQDASVQLRQLNHERIEKLNRLQATLLDPGSLDDKLKKITEGIVEVFHADFCRIWLGRPGDLCDKGCVHAAATGEHECRNRGQCLHLLASSGRYTHIDGAHRRVPFGAYKIGLIASGGDHSFLTNDVVNDSFVHNHQWAQSLGLVSFAGFQLRPPHGESVGVLALFSQHVLSAEEAAMIDNLNNVVVRVVLAAEAEGEVRFQRMLLESQSEASLDGILNVDAHDKVIWFNQRFIDMHKIPPEVITVGANGPMLEYITSTVADPEQFINRVRYMFDHPDLRSRDEVHFRDGRVLDRYTSPVLSKTGDYLGRVWLFRDVTESKQLEEKVRREQENLAAILDAAPVGMLLIDDCVTIVQANKVAQRLFKKSQIELAGARPGEAIGCVHAKDSSDGCGEGPACPSCCIRAAVQGVLVSGQSLPNVEVRPVLQADGGSQTPWMEMNVEPVAIEGRSHVIVSLVDITERMRVEEEVRQSQKLSAVGQLASGIAHEINTPIQYVGDNSRFLQGASRTWRAW